MRPKRKTDSYRILNESYYGDLLKMSSIKDENYYSRKHSMARINTLRSVENNLEHSLTSYIKGLDTLEISKRAKFDFTQIQYVASYTT